MQKVQGKVRVATCEVQTKHILTIIFKVFRCWHIFSTALTFCMLDNPFHAFDVVGCFFFVFKINFFKTYLSGTLSEYSSNDLDPDQDRRSVGAKMGPECLQRL